MGFEAGCVSDGIVVSDMGKGMVGGLYESNFGGVCGPGIL